MIREYWSDLFAVICVGIAIRATISIHPYSGKGSPPMFGDYEAQRHWQEVTFNLSPTEWYKNSSKNNLMYWGLDYPPLTAFHSYVIGKIAHRLNSSYVELKASRGFESASHKSFMRLSVIASDIFLFIPSILCYILAVESIIPNHMEKWQILLIPMLYPGQILIDNGHFQYNNVSLGLAAIAIACVIGGHHILSAFLFTLSLNYKQMELYHSLPFFIYLLRMCMKERFLLNFVKIGSTVILTSITLWLPWISSLENIETVVKRIFPLARGVFEDKVANFWCAVNVILKLKHLLNNQQMAYFCLITTLISCLPSISNLFQRPTKRHFLYSLFNTALCFYLFSFQVHEKSILLVALPAMGLYNEQPFLIMWFLQITTYSMFPLLQRDDLTIPFLVTNFIFFIILDIMQDFYFFGSNKNNKKIRFMYKSSNFLMYSLISFCLFVASPAKYPHLYVLVLYLFTFLHFLMFVLYFVCKQLTI